MTLNYPIPGEAAEPTGTVRVAQYQVQLLISGPKERTMSDEIIRGLPVTITGTEIVGRAKGMVEDAEARLRKLREAMTRVEGMDPKDRELAGFKTTGGDMLDEVLKKIKTQEKVIEFQSFLVDHIEQDATYRMDISQLKIIGIENPYRY